MFFQLCFSLITYSVQVINIIFLDKCISVDKNYPFICEEIAPYKLSDSRTDITLDVRTHSCLCFEWNYLLNILIRFRNVSFNISMFSWSPFSIVYLCSDNLISIFTYSFLFVHFISTGKSVFHIFYASTVNSTIKKILARFQVLRVLAF